MKTKFITLLTLIIMFWCSSSFAGPMIGGFGGGLDQVAADLLYAPISIVGDIASLLDDTSGAVPVLMQAATAFVSTDATPSVAGHIHYWKLRGHNDHGFR
jgi:hypothetical protein